MNCPVVVEIGSLLTKSLLVLNNILPPGPASILSLNLRALSSASIFLFRPKKVSASADVRQPAAQASC